MLIFVGIPLGLWVAYRIAYPTITWHQKLTIVVETPDGERTGSSVTRRQVEFYPPWAPLGIQREIFTRYSGEAVVVDLGGGKYLFTTLREGTYQLPVSLFRDQVGPVGTPRRQTIPKIPKLEGQEAPVPLDMLPLLVAFDDIDDPASVKKVPYYDLTRTFGEGYALKSATLTITDEPITAGEVEKVLGWLSDRMAGMLDGARLSYLGAPNPLASRLSRIDFKR